MSRPEFAGPHDIYLCDFAQAEDLEIYLRGIGITDVETVPVDEADIMGVVRPRAAASAKKTPLSREEKRRRNTASQRERRRRPRG